MYQIKEKKEEILYKKLVLLCWRKFWCDDFNVIFTRRWSKYTTHKCLCKRLVRKNAYPTLYSNPSGQCGLGHGSWPQLCSIWSIPSQDISADAVPSRQILCLCLRPDPPQVWEQGDHCPQQVQCAASTAPAKIELFGVNFKWTSLNMLGNSQFIMVTKSMSGWNNKMYRRFLCRYRISLPFITYILIPFTLL